MPATILKQVRRLSKSVGAAAPNIECNTRKRLAGLQSVVVAEHLSDLHKKTLGLLPNEVILRDVGLLSFRNQSQNVSDAW
jgi:hypothetical protein